MLGKISTTQVVLTLSRNVSFSMNLFTFILLLRKFYSRADIIFVIELFSTFKARKHLSLEDILCTVQNVWKAPEADDLR